MKKILITAAALLFFVWANAQDIQAIKTQVLQSDFSNAKIAIDKAFATNSFTQNAEAWLLRTHIYIALYRLAIAREENDEMDLTEAVNAFTKYRLLDPSYSLVAQKIYNYPVTTLYFVMFDKGGKAYNSSNYQEAYKALSLAVDLGDIMIATKISDSKLDTAAILYAGASAQYLKDYTNAAKYFKRLADRKITGSDNEFLYEFLSQYYMMQRDEANYKLYNGIAKTLYPFNKYFAELDAEYQRLKDPYDFAIQQGADLLDELKPVDGIVLPQKTIDELESKMIAAFDKAAHIKADKAGMAYTYIANHYIMKSITIANKTKDLQEQLKTANADAAVTITKNLNSLISDYNLCTDFAIRCLSDAAEAFAKKTTLEKEDKDNYKSDLNYLVALHEYRKNATAQTDPKLSKWHDDEEKKWSDLLSKLN